MRTIYLLKHIHQGTEIVGTFTDLKKAEKAFDLYADYVQNHYPLVNVEQMQEVEIRRKGYVNFRNGHIVKLEESKLYTDIELFKKLILEQ